MSAPQITAVRSFVISAALAAPLLLPTLAEAATYGKG